MFWNDDYLNYQLLSKIVEDDSMKIIIIRGLTMCQL